MQVDYNNPYMTGRELHYIAQAHANGQLAGDGPFTRRCHDWLEEQVGCSRALLTHSCTAALEMTAMLLDVKPGDEVIMPSFTFVSSANAFAKFGATPVFVDIRPDTLNIDERLVEAAVSPRTRAILVVHYAGVSCNMDAVVRVAKAHDLPVIEDAAQGIMASYRDQPLGGIGDMGTMSFHETKNIIAGEGGCLLLRDDRYVEAAEMIREKGTDRTRFLRGQVDKYTWQCTGSSYLPGEIIAAFLFAQLESASEITQRRLVLWERYHAGFESLEAAGLVQRPRLPTECVHNGHIYYLLLGSGLNQERVLAELRAKGVFALFHYVPLHSSPAGLQLGKAVGELTHTDALSKKLIRLPLWIGMTEQQLAYVIDKTVSVIERLAK